MKIRLRVDVDGMYWDGGAVVEIPELFCRQFEPLKTTDDPMFYGAPNVSGEISEESAQVVLKAREDAAEILSTQLTAMIISEMGKNDTHNGYRKGEV
ncbi:MAG: hypothetical protein V1782_09860 [Pseudomonadota bacterium]